MKQLIVQSVDKSFYNVVELDDHNNQRILVTSDDLDALKENFPSAAVVQEKDIAKHHHSVK